MGLVGETLRQAREAKDLTLLDVEAATKIRLKYLEALENEKYSEIPGRVYVIGFLKSYAKFLGLQDYALVEEYKAANKNEEPAQLRVKTPTTNKTDKTNVFYINKKAFKFSGIALTAVALFAFIYLYQLGRTNLPAANQTQSSPTTVQEHQQNSSANASNQKEPKQSQSESGAEQEENSSGVNVSLKILSDEGNRCWINVIIDGEQDFSGVLEAGDSKDFTGKDVIKIRFGNPRVVQVRLNGKDQGKLSPSSHAITKEFTASNTDPVKNN
ncbi:DUF4115 domain-containing protein [Bacillota bacterium LX-D]|nr:DUF4115 domain-containing protein [Bacillota bacterium LX-D]